MKRFALVLCATLLLVCSGLVLFNLPTSSYAQGSDTATPTVTETLFIQPTVAPPTPAPSATPPPDPCDFAAPSPKLLTPIKDAIYNTATIVLKWAKVECRSATYRLEIRRKSINGQIVVNNTFHKKAFIANLTFRGRYVWTVTACTDIGCKTSGWRKFRINVPFPTQVPRPQPTDPPAPTSTPVPVDPPTTTPIPTTELWTLTPTNTPSGD